MKNLEWEMLEEGFRRLKVPGGWLVHAYQVCESSDSICFYPDPKHEWKL